MFSSLRDILAIKKVWDDIFFKLKTNCTIVKLKIMRIMIVTAIQNITYIEQQ